MSRNIGRIQGFPVKNSFFAATDLEFIAVCNKLLRRLAPYYIPVGMSLILSYTLALLISIRCASISMLLVKFLKELNFIEKFLVTGNCWRRLNNSFYSECFSNSITIIRIVYQHNTGQREGHQLYQFHHPHLHPLPQDS